MKYLIFIITYLAIGIGAHAQTKSESIEKMGGIFFESRTSIATDKAGNLYTAGSFSGTVDLDPGIGVFKLKAKGEKDIFISKVNALGSFVWGIKITGTYRNVVTSLTLDSSGNIYVTGYYQGATDFDPDTGVYILKSSTNKDVFILKLNALGNLSWVRNLKGSEEGAAVSYGMAVDYMQNVYIAGCFEGTIDFDPDFRRVHRHATGQTDFFILKLNSKGDFEWAKNWGGSLWDVAYAIATDKNNNVYITGYFEGRVEFDSSAGIQNLVSQGSRDAFVLKMNSSGNVEWMKQIGGESMDMGMAIAADQHGRVYITGEFYERVDFNPDSGHCYLNSEGDGDVFVLKLDVQGQLVWSKNIGGPSDDLSTSVAVDIDENVYLTGAFDGAVRLASETDLLSGNSSGRFDIFVIKLDSLGHYLWAKAQGGPANDYGFSIAVHPSGNVYSSGRFNGTADFDPGTREYILTATVPNDIYISKLTVLGNFEWVKRLGGEYKYVNGAPLFQFGDGSWGGSGWGGNGNSIGGGILESILSGFFR